MREDQAGRSCNRGTGIQEPKAMVVLRKFLHQVSGRV